jgi:hypothetical protein
VACWKSSLDCNLLQEIDALMEAFLDVEGGMASLHQSRPSQPKRKSGRDSRKHFLVVFRVGCPVTVEKTFATKEKVFSMPEAGSYTRRV